MGGTKSKHLRPFIGVAFGQRDMPLASVLHHHILHSVRSGSNLFPLWQTASQASDKREDTSGDESPFEPRGNDAHAVITFDVDRGNVDDPARVGIAVKEGLEAFATCCGDGSSVAVRIAAFRAKGEGRCWEHNRAEEDQERGRLHLSFGVRRSCEGYQHNEVARNELGKR